MRRSRSGAAVVRGHGPAPRRRWRPLAVLAVAAGLVAPAAGARTAALAQSPPPCPDGLSALASGGCATTPDPAWNDSDPVHYRVLYTDTAQDDVFAVVQRLKEVDPGIDQQVFSFSTTAATSTTATTAAGAGSTTTSRPASTTTRPTTSPTTPPASTTVTTAPPQTAPPPAQVNLSASLTSDVQGGLVQLSVVWSSLPQGACRVRVTGDAGGFSDVGCAASRADVRLDKSGPRSLSVELSVVSGAPKGEYRYQFQRGAGTAAPVVAAPEFLPVAAAQPTPPTAASAILDKAGAAAWVREGGAGPNPTVTLLLLSPSDPVVGSYFSPPRPDPDDAAHNTLLAAYRSLSLAGSNAVLGDLVTLRGEGPPLSTTTPAGGTLGAVTPPSSGSSATGLVVGLILLLSAFAGVGGWLAWRNSQKHRAPALAGVPAASPGDAPPVGPSAATAAAGAAAIAGRRTAPDDPTVVIPGPVHPPLPDEGGAIAVPDAPVGLVGSLSDGASVPEGSYEAPPDEVAPLPELPFPLGLDPTHDRGELVRFLSVDDLQATDVDPSLGSHVPPEYSGRTGAVWALEQPEVTAIGLWFEQRLGFGEDAAPTFVYDPERQLGLLATYDGTGGAGSATVDLPSGPLSGAFLGSRLTRQSTERWFVGGLERGEDDRPPEEGLHDELSDRLGEVGSLLLNRSTRIHGSLRRDLPTTLASLAFRLDDGVVSALPLWAGDSRCHLLTPADGLQQLTVDDTPGADALELLINDAPMTNMVSADRPFVVNARTFQFPLPAVMVSATDGVFGYVATPAHYEFLILSTLAGADTAEGWARALLTEITRYTSDDASLVVLALGYPDFAALKEDFVARTDMMRATHWLPFADVRPSEREAFGRVRLASWRQYRESYEKFLPTTGAGGDGANGGPPGPAETVEMRGVPRAPGDGARRGIVE